MGSIAAQVSCCAALLLATACASASDGATPPDSNPSTLTPSTQPEAASRADTIASSSTSTASPATTDGAITTCRNERGRTTLMHAGIERTALFVPAGTDEASPLLVLFHGFAGVYDEFAGNTGLLTEAADAGVALLVPLGVGEPPTWEVQGGPADDDGYINALLADVATDPCLDADDIWLAGYSAGAGFAGMFACESDLQLAGIVMNAAVFPAVCNPGPIDIVVAHGTADLVVPYTGLNIGTEAEPLFLPSTPELVAGWADTLGCSDVPVDIVLDESTHSRWVDCGGETVDLVTYSGGGHRWPGRPEVGGEGLVVTSPDLTCIVLAVVNGAGDPVDDCST